jgi:hypothetical protein
MYASCSWFRTSSEKIIMDTQTTVNYLLQTTCKICWDTTRWVTVFKLKPTNSCKLLDNYDSAAEPRVWFLYASSSRPFMPLPLVLWIENNKTHEFLCCKPSYSTVSFPSKRNSYCSQTQEGEVATTLSQQEKHTVSNNKVINNERTLLSLLCVCNTWVADRTQMNKS